MPEKSRQYILDHNIYSGLNAMCVYVENLITQTNDRHQIYDRTKKASDIDIDEAITLIKNGIILNELKTTRKIKGD